MTNTPPYLDYPARIEAARSAFKEAHIRIFACKDRGDHPGARVALEDYRTAVLQWDSAYSDHLRGNVYEDHFREISES